MTRLMAVFGLVAALFLVAAPVPAQAAEETGKYYVVGPPVNGQREYLFAIASATLGDGRRYVEIFKLNDGRLQPDGQRMTKPTTVEPGWVLALPKDAKGPGVVSGPLPAVSPAPGQESPSVGTTTSSLRPSGELAAGGGSTAAPLRIWSPTGLWLALCALVVLLLLWRPMTMRSRSRRAATVPAQQPEPVAGSTMVATAPPTVEALTGTTATPTAKARQTTSAVPVTTSTDQKMPVPPSQPATSASATTSALMVPATPDAPPTPTAGPAVTEEVTPADSRRAFSSIALSLPMLAAGWDIGAAGRGASSSPGGFPILEAELTCGPDRATVRLIGTRAVRWGAAHGWLGPQDDPPPSTVPLVLGEQEDRRLWVDLALAPDVFTIGGDPAAVRRQGSALITQLHRAGTEMVVAGDVLGETLPSGVRRIAAVAELAADRPASGIRVLVCAPADVPALRRLLRSVRPSREQLVPVVIGDGPAARWSLRLGEPAPVASTKQ